MVELLLPKQIAGVRFPSSAPIEKSVQSLYIKECTDFCFQGLTFFQGAKSGFLCFFGLPKVCQCAKNVPKNRREPRRFARFFNAERRKSTNYEHVDNYQTPSNPFIFSKF